MNDGGILNNGSVWFPFTGDSASFVAPARYDSHRVRVSVDGIWQGDVLIYGGTPISRTYPSSGFGPGPHVMQVSAFRGEPNIDAFLTPAVGPDYDPPAYTGLVRYKEDHPALLYNGYEVSHRPSSWTLANAPQASEYSYAESSTLSDTVSLTFSGSWLNIGLRTRNRGGLAEVTVDGVSLGTINAYTPNDDVVSYQYDLISGTHTVTITVLDQADPPNNYRQVYLDYIEIWDSTPVTDDFQNASRAAESGRVHVSNSVSDVSQANAIQGDYVDSGLPNSNSNVWYSFVGDAVTFYGLTQNDNADAEIYLDGALIDTASFDYPFSVQPFAYHYTGLDDGPHVRRVHNVWDMRIDGFASNQPDLPYQPIAEWWDNAPAGMAAGDLDGDGSFETVVSGDDVVTFGSLFVYCGDGADTGDGDPILWSHSFGGGVFRTWVSSPALGDLDGQPGAEVVVAAGSELWAFHSDGSTYWFTDTAPIFETLSAPAIGNLDLDPEPEIVANLGTTLEIREHDGTLAWSTVYPEKVNPPVLADLTGDGEIEIVTGMRYDDGSILWSAPAYDSSSANNASVLDLDGDGIYEVAWNGKEQGFTLFSGLDGSVLSNEPDPNIISLTGTDYPLIADVDGDGHAEVIAAALKGVRVFGYGTAWGDARPLWNQHSYHITNINDDLSVPASEAHSWDVHNTYRTQTPLRAPLPVYAVALTHTVGLDGLAVLTDTFNVAPTFGAAPDYGWDYSQTGAEAVVTRTFDLQLNSLQPGESRLVAQGTEVAYSLPSGQNRLVLPPLYVSAPHIAALVPVSQTVGAGATAAYSLTLSNPAASSSVYALSVAGLPAGWATLPAEVTVPASGEVTVQLLVAVPAGPSLHPEQHRPGRPGPANQRQRRAKQRGER